jgi:hypothetical protein
MAAASGGVAGCVRGPGSGFEARTVRLIVTIRKIRRIVRFMAVVLGEAGMHRSIS